MTQPETDTKVEAVITIVPLDGCIEAESIVTCESRARELVQSATVPSLKVIFPLVTVVIDWPLPEEESKVFILVLVPSTRLLFAV